MLTPSQITASIEALQPAPASESLAQIGVRAAHWLLGCIADEAPEIAQTHALYSRATAGDMPTEIEWRANIDSLARARALDLDRARARALDRDLALARARDLALARALDLALARALDLALLRLLGPRLQPLARLDAQVLSAVETPGQSLHMGDWHYCEITHCRGGWAVTLHPQGRELEAEYGTEIAARLIYQSSTGRVPDFFASAEDAMADIRKCALESERAE